MTSQTWKNVRRVPPAGTAGSFPAADLDPPIRHQPNLHNPEETKVFEVGLVLAGAISAGAYIAGVLDFLIEALDVWQEAKDQELNNSNDRQTWSVPGHDVVIPVISGASGGGANAAIVASTIWRNFTHVRQDPGSQPVDNPFFNTWVEGIDVTHLMNTTDLPKDGSEIPSLLNSTRFDYLATRSLETPRNFSSVHRKYIGDPLRILITTTNLRGIPYWMRFQGNTPQGHGLTLHRDHLGFIIRGLQGKRDLAQPPKAYGDEIELAMPPNPKNDAWNQLRRAALATSAFPLVFQSRHLKRNYSDYDFRCVATAVGRQLQYYAVLPSDQNPHYEYLNVDGGATNNEPLELARAILAGRYGRNPRGSKEAMRSTLLVDPFPEPSNAGPIHERENNPASTAFALFNSWINQARFKPDDLALAHDENVYSRFLIAPLRSGPAGHESRGFSLASGVLGGFGSFLCRDYRIHDYLLGRRNCQQFLRHHFVLSAQHPMFNDHWNPKLTAALDQGGYGVLRESSDKREQSQLHLPVIPIVRGSAVDVEEPAPPWPKDSYRPPRLERLAEKRFEALWFATLKKLGVGWSGQTYLGPMRRELQKKIVRELADKLETDLDKRGL